METTTSKSMSLKGYKFKIWLKKNKETIKNLVAAGVGIGVFFLPQIPSVGVSAAAASASTILVKLVADTVDFYISEVEIPLEKPLLPMDVPKP